MTRPDRGARRPARRWLLPLLAATALGAATSGCAAFPFGGGITAAPAGGPSPMGRDLREYRTAFHVHSLLSHDSPGTFVDIVEAARRLGIDAVIFCDHYAAGNIGACPRGLVEGVLLVPGVEMRGNGGSILSFGLEEDFDRKLAPSLRLAEFEGQGAVNVLGHVEKIRDWTLEPFAGFEIYNFHAEFSGSSALGILWRFLFLPRDCFFESLIRRPSAALAAWDRELSRGRRLAPLAGHDAHVNIRMFGALGGTIGTYPEIFRLFSTRILARDLSVESIVEAVRSGRTFVVFDHVGDGAGFAVTYGEAESPSAARAILGDEAEYRPERTLEVTVPPGGVDRPSISVLRDGGEVYRAESRTLSMSLPGPGIYRVEVSAGDRPWIFSGPIYLRDRDRSRRPADPRDDVDGDAIGVAARDGSFLLRFPRRLR